MTEIVNHRISYALERSVKIYWECGGGVGWGTDLNRFYVVTALALSSAVVTQDICSVRVNGF